MAERAKSGKELLALVLRILPPGRYYVAEEIYNLLHREGYLLPADLEMHSGGTETKAYRRLQNGLRDGAKAQQIQKNQDCRPNQYRVPP
jgi:hypothetical protein